MWMDLDECVYIFIDFICGTVFLQNTRLKNQLLSASAKAIHLHETIVNNDISYTRLHDPHKRATPMNSCNTDWLFSCTIFTMQQI